MKMSILGIEYKNIRKIADLKLLFTDSAGKVINNTFIMMANGTGKTTTMTLLKGVLDGKASEWEAEEVKSFAPIGRKVDKGEFNVTVQFDDKQYKYFLCLDYWRGVATIKTTTIEIGGQESGRRLPNSLKDIFTSEFVRRFVFDGEQVKKSMDSNSNEAEETIKYLYCLDKLDNIIADNQKILVEIQDAEGTTGNNRSLSYFRKQHRDFFNIKRNLEKKAEKLRKNIEECRKEQTDKMAQRDTLDKNYKELSEQKQEILKEQQHNKDQIEAQILKIVRLVKSPYLVCVEFSERMCELADGMTKLKLPKNISKDFFVELADSKTCVCGREIGEKEREIILEGANRYLGSDKQAILNVLKSSLKSSLYDEGLVKSFDELKELCEEGNRLQTRLNNNAEKLLAAGGEEAFQLNEEINKLREKIVLAESQLKIIESKDESDEGLTDTNNLYKAELKYKNYEEKIAAATKTQEALNKKEMVETLLLDIKKRATAELKKEIIRKTNEKLQKVITDDFIEVESIDRYIKLKGKDAASEGQVLGIAYCFLGTLFEDADLEFPFVIDSPTGKMDFDKRKAVADIIPEVFNQMIAFVQSAEVEHFANKFYDRPDTQFLTIIASPKGNDVEIYEGIEFFDSYQRDNKGDGQNAF